MKNLLIILLCLSHLSIASAALIKLNPESNKEILTVRRVSKMSFSEYKKLNGSKMSFKDRIAFLMVKKELRRQVELGNGENDITPILSGMMNKEKFRFKIGGFLLGLVFGIFGVGATYLISKDQNVHRSAWIGFGLLVAVALISIFSIYPVG